MSGLLCMVIIAGYFTTFKAVKQGGWTRVPGEREGGTEFGFMERIIVISV